MSTRPVRMPFGKYRNAPLEELPEAYLAWLAGLATLRSPLKDHVLAERHRRDATAAPSVLAIPPELRDVAEEIVATGYRVLAKRAHPDAGGDTETMRQVNAAAEVLRRVVREGGA